MAKRSTVGRTTGPQRKAMRRCARVWDMLSVVCPGNIQVAVSDRKLA